MADPKYASLPGIDTNQPDVFETSDLPEDDQHQFKQEELESESVEQIDVNASEAFKKFKGTVVDSNKIDFSDRISHRSRTGYGILRTEYEISDGPSKNETPQEKFQRLQHEIRELAEEVNQIKENVKADSSTEKLSPVAMAKQVEYLQQQLTDLHLDKLQGGHSLLSSASDPQGALQQRLMSEIESFKPKAGGDAKDKAGDGSGGEGATDHVTYKLYYKPEQAKFSHNAKVADVEQRLERLEALIGSNSQALAALTTDATNNSLVSAVASLTMKTKLFDASQLDQIEGRISALNHKLTQVVEKKEVVEDADRKNKVAELYELVKKWDPISDTLPQVVDRLTALKDLHEQALQFSQALAHLDTTQQQTKQQLGSHGTMLQNVQSTLSDNLKSIQANCDSLDKRITSLK